MNGVGEDRVLRRLDSRETICIVDSDCVCCVVLKYCVLTLRDLRTCIYSRALAPAGSHRAPRGTARVARAMCAAGPGRPPLPGASSSAGKQPVRSAPASLLRPRLLLSFGVLLSLSCSRLPHQLKHYERRAGCANSAWPQSWACRRRERWAAASSRPALESRASRSRSRSWSAGRPASRDA